MAVVYLPTMLRAFAGGRESLEVSGSTVRQVLDNLELECPGLRDRLCENDRLRTNLSVAIDGQVSPLGLLEEVGPASEVHFIAAISGGAGVGRA